MSLKCPLSVPGHMVGVGDKGETPLEAPGVTLVMLGEGAETRRGEQGAQNTQGHGRGNPCGHPWEHTGTWNTQGHRTQTWDHTHGHENKYTCLQGVVLLKGFIDYCREIPRAPRGSGGLSRDDHLLMLLEGDRIQVSPPVPGLKGRAQIVTPLSTGT